MVALEMPALPTAEKWNSGYMYYLQDSSQRKQYDCDTETKPDKFAVLDNQWSEKYLYDKKTFHDNLPREIIQFDGFTLTAQRKIVVELDESLSKHKGDKMSANGRSRFFKIMSEFNDIQMKGCYVAYSVANKFVKSRLHIDNHIVLNTTFFEERNSDVIAFSIEYDGDTMMVGCGKAADIASKFYNLMQSLDHELSI